MSNNPYLENWIETISNLNNNSSEVETSQYSTREWVYMGLNITVIVLLLGPLIGYAIYKSRCWGAVKTLGNDEIADDNMSVTYE